MAANTGLYNSIKTVTGARVSATSAVLKLHVNADPRATTLLGRIQVLAELVDGNIVVLDGSGAEMANLSNRQNGRTRIYYLTYNGTVFTPGKKPGPSPSARRAASLAAAIAEGFPKNLDKKKGPSPGWKAAGTLTWLGQSTGVPLYHKENGTTTQKYVRIKGTDDHIYTYKGWKIVGDDLVWTGGKIHVKSDKIARAIAEAAIRTPAVAGAVTMPASRASFFARLFSRGASPSAVRSVRSNARVASAIRNALTASGAVPVRKLSSIANALRNAFKGRRTTPGSEKPPVTPGSEKPPVTPGGNPGGGPPSGKTAANYIKTKANGTLDLDTIFADFYNQKHASYLYSNKDVVTFYNGLLDYIVKSEKNKNKSVELIGKVIMRLKDHLKSISNLKNNNVVNRLTYYFTNLTDEEAKKIAKAYVDQHRQGSTPVAKTTLSFPSLFVGRGNNIGNAINYSNRQEREYFNRGRGFGSPSPLSNTRRAPSFTGAALTSPAGPTFSSLPIEQKAAIAAQATKNLTPNQKRVVNTAGGAQLVANIVAKAGGANKVKQAAVALQTYSKNNAVRMGLTTNIAANAVNKLGGPMNAVTAAAITNKIVAAMNQKVIANRAAVKRRKAKAKAKPKAKPKAKAAPESPPIRARLLKAMVKKFTKNELVRIAGENALGSKNNKTKNSLVKNFTKFMRRQPKKKAGPVFQGKKGSVPEYSKKKTKK